MNDTRRISPLDGALEMVALGFSVFPLRPGTKDGFCSNRSWKAVATNDPERVKTLAARYHGCNWGVRCSGHVVLDVDVADGKSGEATLLKLELAHDLPPTRAHASARGGQHVIYKLPSGVEVSNRDAPLGGGINVRGVGGYIVCPGSTFEGKPYRVLSAAPVAEAPPSLVELLKAPPVIRGKALPEDQQDHPADIAQAVSWLQQRPTAFKGERGAQIYKAACRCRDWGITRETAQALIADHFAERMEPPGGFDFCEHETRSAYKNAQNAGGSRGIAADFDDVSAFAASLARAPEAVQAAPVERGALLVWPAVRKSEDGKVSVVMKAIENAEAHLRWTGTTVWFDEFSGKTMVRSPYFKLDGEMSDAAFNTIRLDAFKRGLMPPKDHYFDVIMELGQQAKRHPVREYLASLKWDGVGRAASLFTGYTGARDTLLTRAAAQLLLVAAVRRVKQPGCKFDYMVVLEGPQASGKSSFVRILGAGWHGENFSLGLAAREIIEQTRGKWLVEVPELTGMNTTHGQEHVKALLTRTVDEARAAYARFPSSVPRQWVPVASTNSAQYLTDPTGNRRFLPVEASKVDFAALERDRDQLWAEAVVLEKTWGPLVLPAEAAAEHTGAQKTREVIDPVREVLEPLFSGYTSGWVAADEVRRQAGFDLGRLPNNIDANRIKACMTAMGFEHRRQRVGNRQPYVWVKFEPGVATLPEQINTQATFAPGSHLRLVSDNSPSINEMLS